MSREAKLEARALAIAEACLAAGTPELLELAAGDGAAIVDAAAAVRGLKRDADAKTLGHIAFALLTRVYEEEVARRKVQQDRSPEDQVILP